MKHHHWVPTQVVLISDETNQLNRKFALLYRVKVSPSISIFIFGESDREVIKLDDRRTSASR